MRHHNTMQTLSAALITVAYCFVFAFSASAQTVTGTMQGTVRDPNEAVIPGANITVRNTETGQERTLTTNDEGFFIAAYLPLGRYEVTA